MTTEQTTEVEPVLSGALALLTKKPNASLADLAAQVAVVEAVQPHAEAEPFPDLPKHTEASDTFRKALGQILKVFGSVEISTRRSLTQPELDKLTEEEAVIALIATTLKARDEAIRETIRVHMDVEAEEKGIAVPKDKLGPDGSVIVAATPRDQNGHYLLARSQDPHQVQVGPVLWSQEFSQPAPKPSLDMLEALLASGKISREEYLSVTRAERVLDEDKMRALIRKNPKSALALLRKITVTGAAKASLYLRKQS
jgi:hypothetical protein